jgi:hypothetical protein
MKGMRASKYFLTAVLATGLVAGLGVFRAADDKPKYSIEEVMGMAHKGTKTKPSLFKQVVDGKASDEQKKQLVEYYEALCKNKPEKGSEDDWKMRTSAMLKAAKEIADGKDAGKQLAKAANCKACHDLHKSEDD